MPEKQGVARLLKQMSTGDWLGTAIDSSKIGAESERWAAPNIEVHPSSAGSACPRDIQLGMLGHKTEVKPLNRRRMDNGTDAHKRWSQELAAKGLLVSAGVRLKIPGEWSGEYDLLCLNPKTGLSHLGEIKTINSNGYSSLPPQDPDPVRMAYAMARARMAYTYQLCQYYATFRGHIEGGVSPDCFFLFENTDTQGFKIIWVRFDDRMIADAFRNSTAAQAATREQRLIPPPFKRRSMTCSRCYRELVCYRLQDGEAAVVAQADAALLATAAGGTVWVSPNEGREALYTGAEGGQADEDEIYFDE
jgi:hypothetical protein